MMPENKKLPTAPQIDAAQKLYEKMEYWRLEDTILTELSEKYPSLTDQKLTLIKATLVNSFYNARCSDIEEMTSWIVTQKPELPEIYRNIDSNDDIKRIDLVRCIALRGRTEKTSQIQGYVFASKFAHFFLDTDAFPIYDQYARLLVHFHTEDLNEEEQLNSKYGEAYRQFFRFYKKFFQLKQLLEQRDSASYSTKTLDCYLWSAGQYVARKKLIPKQFYLASRISFDDPVFKELFPQAMIEVVTNELLCRELELTDKQKEEWKKRRGEKSNGTQT